ncbi:MAG TPA: pitrilysin family protein [Polyangiaceae bacterium]|nr:pitrilysin family protein [Polyangiaceae bacterium]
MTAAALQQTSPTVMVEHNTDLPLVSISVAVRLGALADPLGVEGATRLLARLMKRSAGGRSAEIIDAEIDAMGGALSVDVSASTIVFHGAVIARSLARFADLLVDVVARPGLDEGELGLLKRETEAELVEALDDDRTLARRWFRRSMFGGHPYGRPISGTATTLAAVTPDTLRALYRRLFVRENLMFAFSGYVLESEAHAIAERIAAALPSGAVARDETPEPAAPAGRRLVIVDKPDRTQTQIIIGGLGSHPSDPDHFPLLLANTAFGGTFTARLMQEVRVKRGWSYGAYASLPYDRRRQAFSMWTFPKAGDAAECIKLELELLAQWRQSGISEGELAWCKDFLVRSHAFAIDTASKRVGLLLDAALYDLPPGYHARYLDAIKAVTLESANRAVAERIPSDNLVLTVVGTEPQIGDSVRSAIANLGHHEVVPYDTE